MCGDRRKIDTVSHRVSLMIVRHEGVESLVKKKQETEREMEIDNEQW